MRTATYFLPILLFALLITSCTGKQRGGSGDGDNKQAVELTFDSVVVEETILLFPDRSIDDPPGATLNISFTYPTTFGAGEQLQKLQAVFYAKVLGDEFSDAASPHEAVQAYAAQYTDFYRGDLQDMYENELEEVLVNNPNALHYGRDAKNKIVFANENLVSFTCFYWEYTGGAHGYAPQFNHSVNLQTLEPVTLDQVLNSSYQAPLTGIIKEKLLRVMEEKVKDIFDAPIDDNQLKSFFNDYDAIEANDNFMLTETGMMFTYNPYDIAAYASGLFEVEIPYGEIAHLLNREAFEKLFPGKDW
ncbi:MAG: DUF3298 domain-containing protein [Fermentimonas sp.]|jgi:hypothetical protein